MGEVFERKLVDQARKLFGDAPCKLQVAALAWRIGVAGPEVMLITSRDTGRWVLPKGGVDGNEKPWSAAAREAHEEAGLIGDISRKPVGRFLYAKVRFIGKARPVEVIVFPLTVTGHDDDWKEKGERKLKWFAPEQAAALVDEPGLAEIIRDFGKDPEAHGV